MSEETRKAVEALEKSATSWRELSDWCVEVLRILGLELPRESKNDAPNRPSEESG